MADNDLMRTLINSMIMTLDDHYSPNDIVETVEEVMDAYVDFVQQYRQGE
jgi:hypothetical protein